MNYTYPMDETWSTNEIIDVVNFFSLIEQAYEKKSDGLDLLLYIGALKRLFRQKVKKSNYLKNLSVLLDTPATMS